MPATEGECGNQLAIAQRMGVGAKDEVNVLGPNNQSSLGGLVLWELQDVAGRWVLGCYGNSGQGQTAPSCWMMDELCSLLKITRWNRFMRCQNMCCT